jgi:HAD superfamily hydrolase (TIGR01509 family)
MLIFCPNIQLTINKMIECVIFDCDGTLVDSEMLCNLGLEIKLKELGIQTNVSSMVARFRGWKLANIVDVLSAEFDLKLDNNFITSYRQVVSDLFDSQLKPIPNIALALVKIPQLKCVASNAPLEKIKQAVRVTDLENFFDNNFFSAYVVQAWKPEPDLFLYAAEMMEVQPKNCFVVEDSILGIEAAQRAGMRSLFYQPHQLISPPLNNTNSFRDMLELPSLIAELK